MSARHFMPGNLECYADLETELKWCTPQLMEYFQPQLDEGQSLIDEDFELPNPEIKDYTDTLALLLTSEAEEEDRRESAKVAAYLSLHFAFLVSDSVLAGTIPVRRSDYFEGLPSGQLREIVLADTQTYLQWRPAVDAVIGHYMPEIDPSHIVPQVAETVAALTFMQIEMLQRERAIDKFIGETTVGSLAGLLPGSEDD